MDRHLPDLSNSIEWNLVGRRNLTASRIADRWFYIPPQNFLIDSYVIQVGLANDQAPSHWFLGAWATMLLPISPSSTTEFVSAVAAQSRKCRLGTLNLLVFPKLVKPWVLEIKVPRWHEKMLIEVWRYDGADIDQFDRFNDLEQHISGNP